VVLKVVTFHESLAPESGSPLAGRLLAGPSPPLCRRRIRPRARDSATGHPPDLETTRVHLPNVLVESSSDPFLGTKLKLNASARRDVVSGQRLGKSIRGNRQVLFDSWSRATSAV